MYAYVYVCICVHRNRNRYTVTAADTTDTDNVMHDLMLRSRWGTSIAGCLGPGGQQAGKTSKAIAQQRGVLEVWPFKSRVRISGFMGIHGRL